MRSLLLPHLLSTRKEDVTHKSKPKNQKSGGQTLLVSVCFLSLPLTVASSIAFLYQATMPSQPPGAPYQAGGEDHASTPRGRNGGVSCASTLRHRASLVMYVVYSMSGVSPHSLTSVRLQGKSLTLLRTRARSLAIAASIRYLRLTIADIFSTFVIVGTEVIVLIVCGGRRRFNFAKG